MITVVNISEARVSANPREVLATYSLGSCVGVALFDAAVRVGGMLHLQLPSSTLDAERARQCPTMFADTGMALLIEEMQSQGADPRRMKVTLAGAAQMLNDNNLFNIGRRNHAAVRKILWQRGMLIEAEDIGGGTPRNLYLQIGDGAVLIKAAGVTTQVA